MQIICVDPSPKGLSDLTQSARSVSPDADVRGCRSPSEALDLAARRGCDVLLTEVKLDCLLADGFVLAEQFQKINPRVNIIFVSQRINDALAGKALALHASGYVRKPYDRQRLAREFSNLRYAE